VITNDVPYSSVAPSCFLGSPASAAPIQSSEIRVVDGDTIEARGVVYRMVGYDAPETATRGWHKVGPDEKALGLLAKAAVKIATKPLLLSHTAISGSPAMGPMPLAARQISRDHARAIAETGSAIGIWHFFPSLDKYVNGLKEMADVVGVDHVCIGTDQSSNPGILPDYAQWVHLVAAMLRGGFSAEEAGKIAGGNYMRVFRAAVG
jgi:membrane dipeptidase